MIDYGFSPDQRVVAGSADPAPPELKRFWVSWISGYYENEGCTKPPFKLWTSSYIEREQQNFTPEQYRIFALLEDNSEELERALNAYTKTDCNLCAVIDATDEEAIWKVVKHHFPDYIYRFCQEEQNDFIPGDRFPWN